MRHGHPAADCAAYAVLGSARHPAEPRLGQRRRALAAALVHQLRRHAGNAARTHMHAHTPGASTWRPGVGLCVRSARVAPRLACDDAVLRAQQSSSDGEETQRCGACAWLRRAERECVPEGGSTRGACSTARLERDGRGVRFTPIAGAARAHDRITRRHGHCGHRAASEPCGRAHAAPRK